jgi:tetratricopeptide (TPR) repeat protein
MIKSIKLETAASRVLLAVAVLACLLTTFFFVKWCFANAIAARAPDRKVAELTAALAPNDPQTHYALAVLNEKTFLPEDLSESLAGFERATARAPRDFRLWLAFGKARERGGDAAGAELALRRASELAPNYAPVQWTLGNILLRRGKIEEAFAEIRRAAENSDAYRLPMAATAWQIFDGNLGDVKKNIGNSANLNSALAVFLAKQKCFAEAVEIWNALPRSPDGNIKKIRQADGEELFNELIAAKRYRDAQQIQSSLSNESEADAITSGKIVNGGFEADVKREKAGVFEWRIGDGAQPQIGFDDRQKLGGTRSLVIVFNSTDGKDFRQISQTTALESAGKYVFEIFYKSNLKTSAALRWEIVDVADDKILAATAALAENADWVNLKTEFTVSEGVQAVTVRLAREPCKSIICPTAGKIWFDDFSIHQ